MRGGSALGTAACACGVVALAICWIPFVDYVSIVVGVMAIVLGALGVRRANLVDGSGKVVAITGIVCGVVALAVALIVLVLIFSVVSTVAGAGA